MKGIRLAPALRALALACGLGLSQGALAQNAIPLPPPRTVDDVLRALAAASIDEGEVRQASAILARPLPESTAPAPERARAHFQRGRAAEVLGQKPLQLDELRRAVATAREAGGQPEARMVSELAGAESFNGNFFTAIKLRESALPPDANRGELLANASVLAHWYAALGDLAQASKYLKEAESTYGGMNLLRGKGRDRYMVTTAQLERARGAVALAAGRYTDSERHYLLAGRNFEDSLAAMDGPTDPAAEISGRRGRISAMINAYRRAAKAQLQQERLVDAEITIRDTLAKSVALVGGHSPLTLGVVNDLASLTLEYGRAGEAAKLAGFVIRTLGAEGVAPDSNFVVQARHILATARANQGRWGEALALFEQTRNTTDTDPDQQERRSYGIKIWIVALVRNQRPADAVAMARRLVTNLEGRVDKDNPQLAEARGYLGLALAANGETQAALAAFRQALPVLLERASANEGGDLAGGRLRRLNQLLEAYLGLLHDLHRSGGSEGFDPVGEAFRIADIARGSVVQQAMTAQTARAAIRDPQLAELARQEQDLGQRIATLQELLGRLVSAPPGEQLPKILTEVKADLPRLREQRQGLRQTIAHRFPEYAELVNPRPVSLAEAQAQLHPGEVLVSLFVGQTRTYVWALPQQGPVAFAAAEGFGEAEVRRAVADLRRTLDLSTGVDINTTPFALDQAHDLYRRLLAPVAPALAMGDSLVIAPHKALGQLPFALLVSEPVKLGGERLPFAAYREVPWLIKRWAVSQLPSVATLVALRKFAASPAAHREAFVGFGDPLFKPGQKSDGASTLQARMAKQAVSLRNAPARRDGPESLHLEQLPPLPDTATEVREIARVLQAGDGNIYLAAQASEGRIKAGALANRRVVLFATHGLVPGDLDGLTQPALALSSPAITGEADSDGLLTMDEVLALRLNADWVVLSACNTASGDGAGSEAVSGLGRAFFYAGARALLVTHWPVETVSARLLTTDLFKRQGEQPRLTRSQALRQSMLQLMADDAKDARGRPEYAYAHPLFWAPFVLVGEGGTEP